MNVMQTARSLAIGGLVVRLTIEIERPRGTATNERAYLMLPECRPDAVNLAWPESAELARTAGDRSVLAANVPNVGDISAVDPYSRP
jgi:hypothetical protein